MKIYKKQVSLLQSSPFGKVIGNANVIKAMTMLTEFAKIPLGEGPGRRKQILKWFSTSNVLFEAAKEGYVDLFILLLQKNVFLALGPLVVTTLLTQNEAVLEGAPDHPELSCFKFTPLHWAGFWGSTEIFKALFNPEVIRILDPKSITALLSQRDVSDHRFAPLHWSAQEGAVGFFEVLLRPDVINAFGADRVFALLNQQDESEYRLTPLHWAAQEARTSIFEILLRPDVINAFGADRVFALLSQRDASAGKFTPLHWAAQEGLTGIFQGLLRPDVINAFGADRVCALLNQQDTSSQSVTSLIDDLDLHRQIDACFPHINGISSSRSLSPEPFSVQAA